MKSMAGVSASDIKAHLFHEGRLYESYRFFGAHQTEQDGRQGFRFCVWAPHAKEVRIAGTFNGWSGVLHQMEKRHQEGIWELFIPGIGEGELYKYEIITAANETKLKADPYAFFSEVRPKTASITYQLAGYPWGDRKWQKKKKQKAVYEKPVSIYELHVGSWKKKADGRFFTYRELSETIIPYVKEHGFTHIELMPLTEHPFDRSWGYQTTGYYSPTSRYGEPHDLMYFIDQCHQHEIGVIMDWVPGHFCKDDHGLYLFDGMPLYEYTYEHDRENWEWGTANFDLGKREVHSFLISNALYWIEMYHIDGFRVDAVANLLYWPNRPQLEANGFAIEFIQTLNEQVFAKDPHFLMIAEDSTDWPLVTHPTYEGGLGFNYKWNMGWMNDVLTYMEASPEQRKHLHHLVSFSLMYTYSENYILPFSHDEVVYGKKSLLHKMPGDYWQKFAQYRLLISYFTLHPGKKLLFMGGEFAQFDEWKDEEELDWFLDDFDMHRKARMFTKEALHLYKKSRILYENDHRQQGFEWIDVNNAEQSIVSFIRYGKQPGEALIIVCNFTPSVYHEYRVGVPFQTEYIEVLNSDDAKYGGSHQINPKRLQATEGVLHGKPYSISMTVPPLGAAVFRAVKKRGAKKG